MTIVSKRERELQVVRKAVKERLHTIIDNLVELQMHVQVAEKLPITKKVVVGNSTWGTATYAYRETSVQAEFVEQLLQLNSFYEDLVDALQLGDDE